MKLCIMDMTAFLMPNLSPVALLVFEIYVTKFPSEEGNKSSNSAIYTRKMGLALKKLVFMSRSVLPDPKLTPPPPPPNFNFSNFQKSRGKFFHFVNFWDLLMRKEQQQPPRLINFAKIWSEYVLKINTESHNIWAS